MSVYVINDEGESPGDIPVTKTGLERRFIKSVAGFLASTGTKAIPAFRALVTADIPTHVLLDGATVSDTVAQTVSRGSLIYGNSTPKWDELVIGGANTVLRSDGTDTSWGALSAAHITDRTRWLPFIPAAGFVTGAVGAPVHGSVGTDAAGIATDVWSLPTAADSAIITDVYMPSDWNSGSITCNLQWSPSNTNTNTCVVLVDATTYAVGDLITKAIVNSVSNTITPSGTALAYQAPVVYTFTPAQPFFKLAIYRFTASASDTFTGDFQLWGALITYTADS